MICQVLPTAGCLLHFRSEVGYCKKKGQSQTNSFGFGFGLYLPSPKCFRRGSGTSPQIVDQFDTPLATGHRQRSNSTTISSRGSPGIEFASGSGRSSCSEPAKSRTYPYTLPTSCGLGIRPPERTRRAEASSSAFTQPQIATQTPAPGTLVNPASAVDLGIQEGPATQTVPAVSGLAQTDAETDIVAAGLLVGNITTEASTTVPGGSVIRQKPVAGTHIMKNFKVDLVVSSAPGNRPPSITSTPLTTANRGEAYSYE